MNATNLFAPSRRLRRAASVLEIFVALTLLTTVLSVSAQMLIRNGRLLVTQRHYNIALDELSNQMDRLSALSADELSQALNQLAPSEFAAAHLPGAKLTGQLKPGKVGAHLTLQVSWNDPQRQLAPVSLATWVFAKSPAGKQSVGSNTL